MTVTEARPAVALLRGARYARISDDKAGDAHGVANQIADQAAVAAARGIRVVMTCTDNDMEATSGRRRPGYEAVMAAVARGEIDVIVVFQLSRLWRNRRERADGIEVLRKHGVSIIATKGPSLDMSTAQGRMVAGILGEVDTAETEIKAERQVSANGKAARRGKRRAGPRAFGYERTHERCTPDVHRCTWHQVPEEAAAIRSAAAMILGGGSISGVMREWNAAGLRPAQAPFGPLPAKPWTRQSIRGILLNPTVGGFPVYGGEIIELDDGAVPNWEPILPSETWEAVRAVLKAPERKVPRGVRTLGGGLYRCQCGNHMEATVNHRGARIYRCSPPTRPQKDVWPGTHVSRAGGPVDSYVVSKLIIERLSRPDAAVLLAKPAPAGPDVAQLREEYTAIRANLDELAADRAMGLIDRSAMLRATERGRARMAEIDAQIAASVGTDVLDGVTGPGARQVWESLDLSRQRAILRALMTVTLLSPGRGNRRDFDPSTVRIEWLRG